MLFRRISHHIAMQFTAFVFVLLLLNGALFLAADLENARRQSQFRVARSAELVLDTLQGDPRLIGPVLAPMIRERVRLLDDQGTALYTGELFSGQPFFAVEGIRDATIDGEQYIVLTTALLRGPERVGYLQVAELERLQLGDLPIRALLYLLVSVGISALTFVVGLFFARRSLRPAEQMVERLEQFTQDASHELRTPLAALSSSLDLALRTGEYQDGIRSAKEDLGEVASLVERLLELARLDKLVLRREKIDLSGLAQDAVERHRALAAERTVTLEGDIADGVIAQGDAGLLRQVLGNLLSNAIKFSKREGGTVRVRLDKHALRVEDEGIGIAASALPRIFDRFYQAETSRADEGYGLGLALVKRIVELHGWSIRAESEEGKGTVFTVTFGNPPRKSRS